MDIEERADHSYITSNVIDQLIKNDVKVSVYLHENLIACGPIYRKPGIDELRVDAATFTISFIPWDIRITLGGTTPRINL